MSDENIFFRLATLSILSSLSIETALWKTLSLLKTVMPADEILIHVYDPGLKAVRTLARATAEGGKKIDRVTSVPVDPRPRKVTPEVTIINRPHLDPMTNVMAEAFGKPYSSVLAMRLVLEDSRVGMVTLRADGTDAYNEGHKHLFSLLNEPFAMALMNALRHEDVVRLSETLADESRYFQRELAQRTGQEVVGEDFGLRATMEMVHQVAPLMSPILILGETGTGKEVIANAIHNLSNRRKGALIKVNCGAIPETLLDSELFWPRERGLHRGSRSKEGAFRTCP